MKTPPFRNRSELLTLLSEACELEHGLACSYLYAAFSLKQDLSEGGLTWDQLQKVRLWAAQIFHVAAEEMLHLAQAWNLLSAMGGMPWYGRPNFPQPCNYYPLNLPLEARPFSLGTLERFIAFETPSDPSATPLSPVPGDDAPDFRTVGELYGLVAQGILSFPEKTLFLGDPRNQVDRELVDFPNLTVVKDRPSALQAIHTITEQGEGNPGEREDSHYHVFRNIRRTFLRESLEAEERGLVFAPVRQCISNPVAFPRPHLGAPLANPIFDPYTAAVADAFDSIYILMLRMLQYVFDNATGERALLQAFGTTAIRLMAAVIKPHGEALTLMPAGERQYGAAVAGPPFSIGRHVPLPLPPAQALQVAQEKLRELQQRLAHLAGQPRAPLQLQRASANFSAMQLP